MPVPLLEALEGVEVEADGLHAPHGRGLAVSVHGDDVGVGGGREREPEHQTNDPAVACAACPVGYALMPAAWRALP